MSRAHQAKWHIIFVATGLCCALAFGLCGCWSKVASISQPARIKLVVAKNVDLPRGSAQESIVEALKALAAGDQQKANAFFVQDTPRSSVQDIRTTVLFGGAVDDQTSRKVLSCSAISQEEYWAYCYQENKLISSWMPTGPSTETTLQSPSEQTSQQQKLLIAEARGLKAETKYFLVKLTALSSQGPTYSLACALFKLPDGSWRMDYGYTIAMFE